MDGLRVRAAGADDLAALDRLVERQSVATRAQRFGTPLPGWPPAMRQAIAQADPAQRFVLALAGDEPVALGQLAIAGDEGELALLVDEGWQGRGVGRRLLAALLDEGRAAALQAAVIDTVAGNRPMCALAQRAGFALARAPGGRVVGRRSLRS